MEDAIATAVQIGSAERTGFQSAHRSLDFQNLPACMASFHFSLSLVQEKIHPTVGSDFWQVSALSFDNAVKNEQKDRPANRQQQADGIETRNGPKPQIGSDKTAYERSPYPDQNRQDKPAGVLSRHDEFGKHAYDQTHNDPR